VAPSRIPQETQRSKQSGSSLPSIEEAASLTLILALPRSLPDRLLGGDAS